MVSSDFAALIVLQKLRWRSVGRIRREQRDDLRGFDPRGIRANHGMGAQGCQNWPKAFDWKDHSGWLYAFVIDGDVKYIGLTTRVLRSRMADYSHVRNSQTDEKRALVLEALSDGKRVLVYGIKHRDERTLAAAEARLRGLHRPPWNRI